MKNLLLTFGLLLSALGCDSASETDKYAVQLNDKEAELFESILRSEWSDHPKDDKGSYYLTCTPASDWCTRRLKNLPDSFHRRISDLPIRFKRATEAAHLGDVFFKDPTTGKSAFMVWININKWISKTEVEVEQGMWHEPLWGHGSTSIYVKTHDGRWHRKKTLTSWIS